MPSTKAADKGIRSWGLVRVFRRTSGFRVVGFKILVIKCQQPRICGVSGVFGSRGTRSSWMLRGHKNLSQLLSPKEAVSDSSAELRGIGKRTTRVCKTALNLKP